VLLVAALAVLAFNLALPTGWTASSPLPWDEAGHFLGALEVHDALGDGETAALRRVLLDADQYPPGHSITLGTWMTVFGVHVASWLTFGLLVYVLTAVLLARLHVAAGLIFIGLGMFGGLAPSLMVEQLAVLWVVVALTLVPRSLESRQDWLRFAASWLAACCALMTKYNFGLPLVAALAFAGVIRWNRRSILATLAGAVTVLGGWALFLSAQDQGWEMFQAFARNRANSVGMSPFDRLDWYLDAFRNQWTGSTVLLIGLVLAVVLSVQAGIRRGRDPRFFAAALLALGSLASFALHPYLLGRNLVILVVAVTVVIGAGLRGMEWGGRSVPAHAFVIAIALFLIPTANAKRTRLVEVYYPATARELQPVSSAVEEALAGGGFVRVVGTFNEFGAGWVRLLQSRSDEPVTVTVDAPYPLARDREALDPRWDPAYGDIVDAWTRDGTRSVIAIEVDSRSHYHDEGYERWNAWKLNLLRALDQSDAFSRVRTDSLEAGISIVVYENKSGGVTLASKW